MKSNNLRYVSRVVTVALVCAFTVSALADGSKKSSRKSHRAPSWTPGELAVTGGGCPIETPDGLSLMFASGRDGGVGGLDIWVVDRESLDGAWSEPKNLPEPVNSTAADFCPSPLDRALFFVSARESEIACGGGDIYLSRQSPAGDWSEPMLLPCAPDGPNTAGTERSPSLVQSWYGTFLFYSSNGGIEGADDDIYVSRMNENGEFEEGQVVDSLSTPDYQDQMPTVRQREDGGYEVVFNSDRPALGRDGKNYAQGGQDAYYATADYLPFWWSSPRNLGPNVNTELNETRASLSRDGERLYVGRGDIYVSQRKHRR